MVALQLQHGPDSITQLVIDDNVNSDHRSLGIFQKKSSYENVRGGIKTGNSYVFQPSTVLQVKSKRLDNLTNLPHFWERCHSNETNDRLCRTRYTLDHT